MSSTLQNLPKFFRLPDSSIAELPVNAGAIYFSPDRGKLYIDSDDSRVDLSPVKRIATVDDLPQVANDRVYITNSGSLFINSGGSWYEYSPVPAGEATYMYRFEVSGRPEELRFDAGTLGVSHFPEFDVLNTDYTNISGADWLSRGWQGSDYVIKASGGFPDGTYYLKVSYNVKNDASGTYIQDDLSTQVSINLSAGEHYIFSKPLNALSIVPDLSCRGISTVQFTTGSEFSFSVPSTTKFTNAIPTFLTETSYYLTSQNGIMTVSTVVSQ